MDIFVTEVENVKLDFFNEHVQISPFSEDRHIPYSLYPNHKTT